MRERSTVYAAVDSRNNMRAAVKVLSPGRLDGTRPEVDFAREVRLAEAVEHPHLLTIRDWGWEGGRGWIAYELAADGSLQDRIGSAGHLEAVEVRRLALQVGEALLAIHRANLLHRDVKPSNILIDGPRYLLGDFGAVRWNDPEVTSTLVGSVPYMAPEQAQGQLSPEADVYCLGATLYRAWTGNVPPPLAQREPEWPAHTDSDPRLRDLITAMLHPAPERRPSLDSLEDRLRTASSRRLVTPLVAGVGALMVVGAATIFALQANAAPDNVAAMPPAPTPTTTAASALAAVAPLIEYPDGALVMVEQDPHTDWGPNPVYYLYRGVRFHVGSPEVLEGQVSTFRTRAGPERLGWVGWPECCLLYAEIEHLADGPELVYGDARSDGLLVRRDGKDGIWIVRDGIREAVTKASAVPGPQGLDDAIVLAAAVFDAIPTERSQVAEDEPAPPCLVAGGAIASLYELHREGLGEVLNCEEPLPDRGAFARWENGTIWWAPGVGAYLTVFAIDAAYWAQGGALGWLGYPTSDEGAEPSGQWERLAVFERGVMTWSASIGTESMTREEYLEAGGVITD